MISSFFLHSAADIEPNHRLVMNGVDRNPAAGARTAGETDFTPRRPFRGTFSTRLISGICFFGLMGSPLFSILGDMNDGSVRTKAAKRAVNVNEC